MVKLSTNIFEKIKLQLWKERTP